jgi:hypothetical protein
MRAHAPSILAALLLHTSLSAQTPPPPPPETPSPSADPQPAPTGLVLPALTPVRIEILETLNSKTSRIGARFPILLASPIDIPGGGQVPAGITGWGDVVHAAKLRFGGKPGELILAVRYLDFGNVRIPLRSLTYDDPLKRRDNTDLPFWSGLPGYAPRSWEVNIPAGTIANAKTSAPVPLSAVAAQIAASSVEQGDPKP